MDNCHLVMIQQREYWCPCFDNIESFLKQTKQSSVVDFSPKSKQLDPFLLTWFNFNPSMDK